MNASGYLMLPWSIRGPARVEDERGNVHYEMRIAERPDFLVAASSEGAALYDFKAAVLAFLESYTDEGEVPPHPEGSPVEYHVPPLPRRRQPGPVRVPTDEATAGRVAVPVVLL